MSKPSETSSMSSGSSGGEVILVSPPKAKKGRKKQIPPSKRWIFTYNNYPDDWRSSIVPVLEEAGLYHIGEEIAPTTGTPHLQGYVEFSKKLRPFSLALPKQISWKKAKGNKKSNINYCSKDGKYVTNFPDFRPKYTITIDLYPWQKIINTIVDQEPDDRTIHWVWEATGCAGKTTFQKWLFLNKKDVIALSGKAADMKHAIVEYEKKNSCVPRTILINIPRTSMSYVSYAGIEDIKDMFFFSGKYEGGMVCGRSPHVFIFANTEPDYQAVSLDRWRVMDLSMEKPAFAALD